MTEASYFEYRPSFVRELTGSSRRLDGQDDDDDKNQIEEEEEEEEKEKEKEEEEEEEDEEEEKEEEEEELRNPSNQKSLCEIPTYPTKD